MKIVNIAGGLGNQMFQYAFACYLKYLFPDEDVLLDTHHFAHYKLHNGYELNRVFPNLSIPIASKEQVKKLARYIPHYKLSRLARRLLPVLKTEYIGRINMLFDECVGKVEGDCYYDGYWQAIDYSLPIRAKLQKEFEFPSPNTYNTELKREINNCNSVGIHVRRGDYLKEKDFRGICDIEYYKTAISFLFKENPTRRFYIFSNDMEWCQENIEPMLQGAEVCYVTGNMRQDSCWDIFLMNQCKSLIVANSSFSWWGAFLNKNNPLVIAPKQWKNGQDTHGMYAADWILL